MMSLPNKKCHSHLYLCLWFCYDAFLKKNANHKHAKPQATSTSRFLGPTSTILTQVEASAVQSTANWKTMRKERPYNNFSVLYGKSERWVKTHPLPSASCQMVCTVQHHVLNLVFRSLPGHLWHNVHWKQAFPLFQL